LTVEANIQICGSRDITEVTQTLTQADLKEAQLRARTKTKMIRHCSVHSVQKQNLEVKQMLADLNKTNILQEVVLKALKEIIANVSTEDTRKLEEMSL
jgi:hypothetical protein